MNKKKNTLEVLMEIYKIYIRDPQVAANLSENTKLEELSISSVDYIKIIIDIENEFDFEFDDEDLAPGKFITIGQMVDYIEKK